MTHAKTIEQWLKELPKEIRPNKIEHYAKNTTCLLSFAVLFGFNWGKSKEGSEFWEGFYESLKWAEEA